MSGAVFYQSVERGIANPAGLDNVTYFGITFRIPRQDHATIRQLEWETTAEELRQPVELPDGRTLEPDERSVIERFETYDQHSGDVLVLYRVPYRVIE